MGALEQFVAYLRSAHAPDSVRLIRVDTQTADVARWVDDAAVAVVVGSGNLDAVLACSGLHPALVGWSPEGERIALLGHQTERPPRSAPAPFRVTAVMPVFNEADVIEHTLRYLVDDGIGVYVIDNWSTDATLEVVRRFEGRGVLGVERFPFDRPADSYDLRGILARVEALTNELDADWFMLHDADERRRSPWPDASLRAALYHVDRLGYTCIDHVTLNFWPTDDGYTPARDIEDYFSHFEFSTHPGHFHQRRAWKNLGLGVSLVPTAGHDVGFDGRRVYPYKFLLKHYPARSQAHGERKVLHERRARWNAAERALGWHQQYDDTHRFVREASELERFETGAFYERRLVERLSGVGVFDAPPAWATPPLWHSEAVRHASWPAGRQLQHTRV